MAAVLQPDTPDLRDEDAKVKPTGPVATTASPPLLQREGYTECARCLGDEDDLALLERLLALPAEEREARMRHPSFLSRLL